MATKKLFITGGAGFIGYFLCEKLLSLGHEPIVFDAFLNYANPCENHYQRYLEYRLKKLSNRARVIRGDIRDRGFVLNALEETKPDLVIHLAAVPLAKASNQFSEEAIQVNLNGTISLLESIRRVDCVEGLIYTSTSFIYGDFAYEPADEKHPAEPLGLYGGSKLAGEVLVKAFSRRFGKSYTIVRPSGVYGPTDSNGRVSETLVESAIRGMPLTVHNSGTDRIDFTYVKDTAHGLALAALSDKARNETFNITRGEGRSIQEFADVLRKMFPDLQISHAPSTERRPNRGALDIKKAREYLGYSPSYSLEDGIHEYVDFILSNGFMRR